MDEKRRRSKTICGSPDFQTLATPCSNFIRVIIYILVHMVYDSTRPFSFFCQSIFEILFTNLELADNVDAFDDITF